MNELVYLRAETGLLRTAGGALVVPVVALIGDTILHAVNSDAPEFVPASVLSSNVAAWANKPVVNGHPVDHHGRQMSANSPDVLAAHAFGTIANARVENRRLLMDCHLDPTKAEQVGAGPLLARLRAGQTSEISVGCFVTTDNTPGTHAGKPYSRRWLSLVPDHVAAVSRGACSCDAGCGFQRAAQLHKENDMEEFPLIDAYTEHLKRLEQLRAASATAEQIGEENYRQERAREFKQERAEMEALWAAEPPQPRFMAEEEEDIPVPDSYAADIKALQLKEARR